MNNKTKAKEFLTEWATGIERKLKNRLTILSRRYEELSHEIVALDCEVDADRNLSSSDVVEVVLSQGLKFSRETRYFFVYEKDKRFLYLLVYPFERIINHGRSADTKGRE